MVVHDAETFEAKRHVEALFEHEGAPGLGGWKVDHVCRAGDLLESSTSGEAPLLSNEAMHPGVGLEDDRIVIFTSGTTVSWK